MQTVVRFWKADSARIMSIILALAAAGFIPGTAGKVIGVVLPLLGGQAVRQTVWSPGSVVAKVGEAAAAALQQAAPVDVGPPGQISAASEAIVADVVKAVAPAT